MSKNIYGEKRFYKTFRDDHFMHTKIAKEKIIDSRYEYLPKTIFGKAWAWFLYYAIAVPFLRLGLRIKYGVKVLGKSNIRKIKGGAVIIGNHSCVMDACFASVFAAAPKRNYIISNKDAVMVTGGRFFTKSLGALPLPDDTKTLYKLANVAEKLLKSGKTLTIYPEATIWPYATMIRPMPAATFHYAVKADVPVVPMAVTYRYARGKNKLAKKPKVNINILEPIYPNLELAQKERKQDLAARVEAAIRAVVETPENVALYSYEKVDELV